MTSEHQVRLAAVESLIRYARVGVTIKKGDSAKLERAENELDQAIQALSEIRQELAQRQPNPVAEAIALCGESSAANYLRLARRCQQ